jgi:hypothetical protein
MVASESKALFVVAQIGQAKRMQELVKNMGLGDVDVAVLFTRKNLAMPALIQESISEKLVHAVHRVEIHPASNEISVIASKHNIVAYRRLLDTVKPASIFVCSWERHYAILCQEAHRRGIAINLFEEGTAIYKTAIKDYSSFLPPSIGKSAMTIYNRVWKNEPITKYVIRPVVRFLYPILKVPYLLGRTVHEIYKTPQVQNWSIGGDHAVIKTGWNKFSSVYASNPEILKGLFNANKIEQMAVEFDNPLDTASARDIAEHLGIDGQTALFVSQRFDVDPRLQVPAVVKLLNDYAETNGKRILVKLHPREKEGIIALYKGVIEELGAEERVQLIESGHVPAEYLVVHTDISVLIGISSSTMMYAPKAKPSLNVVSISNALRSALVLAGADANGVKQIADHSAIIDLLPYVEEYKPSKRR